jgi:SAM-dependent methyltransferase
VLNSNKLKAKLKSTKKKLAEQAKCPLCQEKIIVKKNTLASYEKPDQYEIAVGIKEAFYYRRWVKCHLCSMVFSIYSRSDNSFDYLYKELYRKVGAVPWRKLSTEATFELVLKLSPEKSETVYRVNFIKDKIASLIKSDLYSKKIKYKLLDIGGATGSFAFAFKEKKWESIIIDPDESGKFIKKYNIEFKQGWFTAKSFDFKFDLISLIFVLEHVLEPSLLLREIRKSLLPNGLIYIEVPDEIAFYKIAASDDVFNSCHLYMFNPSSLEMLLSQNNFEIMSLDRTRTVRGHFALTCLAKPR